MTMNPVSPPCSEVGIKIYVNYLLPRTKFYSPGFAHFLTKHQAFKQYFQNRSSPHLVTLGSRRVVQSLVIHSGFLVIQFQFLDNVYHSGLIATQVCLEFFSEVGISLFCVDLGNKTQSNCRDHSVLMPSALGETIIEKITMLFEGETLYRASIKMPSPH